jgi:hypothetical protein
MRIVYIADDGKEFDDEYKCKEYEWCLHHPNLQYVRIYDADGIELNDFFSEDTYGYSDKIVVPTDFAAKELQDLAEYTGYCYYAHITEAGTWVFDEEAERFIKESE